MARIQFQRRISARFSYIFLWLAKKKNSHVSIEKRPMEEEKTVIGIKINEDYRLSKKKKSRPGVLFLYGNSREKKKYNKEAKDEKEGGKKTNSTGEKKETCKAAKKESNKVTNKPDMPVGGCAVAVPRDKMRITHTN